MATTITTLSGTPAPDDAKDDIDIIMSIVFKWVEVLFQTSPTVAAGMTSFLLSTIVFLISGISSRILFKTYRDMSLKDQHRWNSGVNRACGGMMLATRGFSALMQGVPDGGIVWGTNPYLERTSAFALGFFLFEIRDSLNLYFAHGIYEETLVVHHACGVLLYIVALASQSYQFLVAVVLVEEICAPMVHIGWALTKLEMGNHFLWAMNQYILVFAWSLFRIGTDIVVWWYLLTNFFEVIYGPAFPTLFNVFVLALLSVVLNPYWLSTKWKQMRNRDIRYGKAR
eukprot:m.137637 g.137637  ORF g.137637 m.137637 type:complete len:284 (-) comp29933_c0_seq3:133-984(-)